MANTTITLCLQADQEQHLFHTFQSKQTKAPPYAKWQLKCENCVITCYNSGKTVFQGKDAEVYASAFQQAKPTSTQTTSPAYPQAGSDEVGTGDYFGPVCVAATIVDEEGKQKLLQLGVRDSKKLSDEDIRRIAPSILQSIPYSQLILSAEKYNVVHETNNMNQIKAKLHNQAYVNLDKKYGLPAFKIVDQFTPETSYYRYLKSESNVVRGIHFETKAEDKYLAVGAASILARYAFLTCWDEMETKYGMHLEKGAGSAVDRCAREFVKKFGRDELQHIAKMHFKNTERI